VTTICVPSVTVELATLVDTKDKIDVLAGTEGLIERGFIMFLRSPKPFLDAQIQIILRETGIHKSSKADDKKQ